MDFDVHAYDKIVLRVSCAECGVAIGNVLRSDNGRDHYANVERCPTHGTIFDPDTPRVRRALQDGKTQLRV